MLDLILNISDRQTDQIVTAALLRDITLNSKILNVGDFIEPLNTPSIGEYNISEITTDINPNKDFYKHSIAEALTEKKPIFI